MCLHIVNGIFARLYGVLLYQAVSGIVLQLQVCLCVIYRARDILLCNLTVHLIRLLNDAIVWYTTSAEQLYVNQDPQPKTH